MEPIASEIERLRERILRLEELRSSPHATPELFASLGETLGEGGIGWLLVRSPALGGRPVDWVLAGRTEAVLELLVAIRHGVYV